VRVGLNQLNRGLSNIYLQFGMQVSCVELLFKSFSGSKKKRFGVLFTKASLHG